MTLPSDYYRQRASLSDYNLQLAAHMNLLCAQFTLRERLRVGDVSHHAWVFDDKCAYLPVARGRLIVWRPTPNDTGFPRISYSSCMGANSDNSYSSCLPGVTFEEALLLVYKVWKRSTTKLHV
jgi:hypothetical protein